MDPFSAAGLGLEAFGVTKATIQWIVKKAGKKLRIVPHEIESTTKKWVSTQIIVQNKSEDPLFDIQIVCWLEDGQEIKIKPKHMQQIHDIGGLEMDTAFYLVKGIAKEKHIELLEFSRIMPKESFEIEVQIHRKGKVRFVPLRYNEDTPRQLQEVDNGVAIPFKPPFDMQIESMGLWLKRKED